MDCYSRRLDDALLLVAQAFRDRRRKGTDVPYLSHLLQVMVTVAEHGGDEDQLVAALLHDYLEDVEAPERVDLAVRFGPRVAALVEQLSDTTVHPKPPWTERKQAYLAHLHGAPPDVKLISAADKLHNARCTWRDVATHGLATFDRFNAGQEQVLWYYRGVVDALGQGWSHPVLDELRIEVALLVQTVRAADRHRA